MRRVAKLNGVRLKGSIHLHGMYHHAIADFEVCTSCRFLAFLVGGSVRQYDGDALVVSSLDRDRLACQTGDDSDDVDRADMSKHLRTVPNIFLCRG
jgi:hypothetical protein